MNDTEELRRMLDEHRVEWEAFDDFEQTTQWSTYNGAFVYWARERDGKLLVETTAPTKGSASCTPAQAIAATLGAGTCQRRPHVNLTIGDNFLKQSGWDCSECGCRLDLPVIARYCPNCGRKVVDE